MDKRWIYNHQKLLTTVGGIFFLLLTFTLYFWTAPKEISIEGKSEQTSVTKTYKRSQSNMIQREQKPDLSKLVTQLKERKERGRTFLLVLLFIGIAMILYSFFLPSKKRDS